MSAPRLTVYVAHHRSPVAPLPEPPPYLAVCNVRPDGSRPPGFTAYDDEGGLPHSNAAYNELSVLHRLHERAATELVGLSHYRRTLLARRPTGRRGEQPGSVHVRGWDWRHPERWAGDEAALAAAMDGLDWATPRPFDVRRAGYRSLWEHFAGNHEEELLRRADGAVRAQHPDLEPLGEYLRRETATPLYNVFLGRREVLHRYGAFLWPVLAACAPGLELGDYQGRWAGFVAERLHGYWLAKVARPSGVRVGALPLGLLDVALPPRRQRLTGIVPAPVSLALVRGSRWSQSVLGTRLGR
ncbi:MAG: DUF4422 domain-containing protein [Mycobacteriales bacterium]